MLTLRNTAVKPTQRRHMARVATAIGLAVAGGLTGLTAACADGPTAPSASAREAGQAFVPGPHRSVAPASTVVGTLGTAAPLPSDVAFRFTVQPGGSTLNVAGGAAVVRFPAGFVARPTTFTITRKAGNVVGYDFQPSGTFNKPVTVTIKLAGTARVEDLAALQGAYVQDWAQVDATAGTARVDELVPTTVDAKAGTVTLTLSHFSGYLMSTGRTR